MCDDQFTFTYFTESPLRDESFRKLRETFVVKGKIGAGTFSKVYLAYVRGDAEKKQYAIKHIKQTTHPEKLRREMFCLLRIGWVNRPSFTSTLNVGSVASGSRMYSVWHYLSSVGSLIVFGLFVFFSYDLVKWLLIRCVRTIIHHFFFCNLLGIFVNQKHV